jgi:hypothetical protein
MVEKNAFDTRQTLSAAGFAIQLGVKIDKGDSVRRVILGNGFGVVGRDLDSVNKDYLKTHLDATVLLRPVKKAGAVVVDLQPGEEVIVRNLSLSNAFEIA